MKTINTVIIADDLTGACDTGIKLKNSGFSTSVLTDCAAGLQNTDCEVVSINTDTRASESASAYKTVSELMARLRASGVKRVYKKIDSVLRGNVGAEISAILDSGSYEAAVVCPALPENGRTMTQGRLYLNGEGGVNVLEIISRTSERQVALIPLCDIRRGARALCERIDALCADGFTIICTDAENDADLRVVADAVLASPERVLPVGSAGLASLLYRDSEPAARETRAEGGREGYIVAAIGSRHPITVAQVAEMARDKSIGFYTFNIADVDLPGAEPVAESVLSRVKADRASGALREIICVTTEQILSGKVLEENHSVFNNANNPGITDAITSAVSAVCAELPVAAVISCGGDIAGALLKKLGVSELVLESEPYPGIVIGHFAQGRGTSVLIATKSGGFGDEGALVRLIDYIKPGITTDIKQERIDDKW